MSRGKTSDPTVKSLAVSRARARGTVHASKAVSVLPTRLDDSEMGKIFRGSSPADAGFELETTEEPPEGAPVTDLPERPEEFAPGLTPELMEMVAAVRDFK
jgi:Mn-containing catalase